MSGSIVVAVQHQPAVRADMRAHGQTLVHPCATAAAVLRRIRRVDRFHSLPGAGCLASEDGAEGAPLGVVHGLVAAGCAAGPVVFVGAALALLGCGTAAQV